MQLQSQPWFVHTLIIASWLANTQLHTWIHGKMRLQLRHLTCAYSDLCLMAGKDRGAHTDAWLNAGCHLTNQAKVCCQMIDLLESH